jgi:hypothetical protein
LADKGPKEKWWCGRRVLVESAAKGKKKNQKVRLPDLGSFARGVRVDGGAPVLPRIPQYAADPVDYLFCGGDWRSGTPITMFGVSIRDPGLEAKIIM